MYRKYLALLRGINVGGKNKISMKELVDILSSAGIKNVKTYIQSGNFVFVSKEPDTLKLARKIENVIFTKLRVKTDAIVFDDHTWQEIIRGAPKSWGHDDSRKHNLLVILDPKLCAELKEQIGVLKPGIESLKIGNGVAYQSLSLKMFGRTTGGKLASRPIYKKITIRGYNTTIKLGELLQSI